MSDTVQKIEFRCEHFNTETYKMEEESIDECNYRAQTWANDFQKKFDMICTLKSWDAGHPRLIDVTCDFVPQQQSSVRWQTI